MDITFTCPSCGEHDVACDVDTKPRFDVYFTDDGLEYSMASDHDELIKMRNTAGTSWYCASCGHEICEGGEEKFLAEMRRMALSRHSKRAMDHALCALIGKHMLKAHAPKLNKELRGNHRFRFVWEARGTILMQGDIVSESLSKAMAKWHRGRHYVTNERVINWDVKRKHARQTPRVYDDKGTLLIDETEGRLETHHADLCEY